MEVKKVILQNFKRFSGTTIELKPKMQLVVGGNNSGKSSLLHALVVWEFCKTVLLYEKGERALLQGFDGNGQGVSLDEFTPMNIPSFKYLWTNLQPGSGYTLKIKCVWEKDNEEKHLEIGMAYNHDRLLVKNTASNLVAEDRVPHVAYLPTFAGVSSKEQWYSVAMRNKLIGQGLAGSVIRNQVMELFLNNEKLRVAKKGNRKKISDGDLRWIRENDPYELLNQALGDVFRINLYPSKFIPEFHTHVVIDIKKGKQEGVGRFKPHKNFYARDVMAEGSGFLQWLSVYTFALSPNIDVLLLDEPDAHLHCTLQTMLFERLGVIADKKEKQVLVATHSPEVIKATACDRIMQVDGGKIKFLQKDEDKCVVLSSIGTEYFPLLEALQRNKKVLFVENTSDGEMLKIFCNKYSQWPNGVVVWPCANTHKERKQFFIQIKDKLPGLKAISLHDRDNGLIDNVDAALHENGMNDWREGDRELRYRTWRRWEMESYLLCPDAMARLLCAKDTSKTVEQHKTDVEQFVRDKLSRVFPRDYLQTDVNDANRWMFDVDAKAVLNPICEHFQIDKYAIAREMREDEIFVDVKTLIKEIVAL